LPVAGDGSRQNKGWTAEGRGNRRHAVPMEPLRERRGTAPSSVHIQGEIPGLALARQSGMTMEEDQAFPNNSST
jgi:hypothetical protein